MSSVHFTGPETFSSDFSPYPASPPPMYGPSTPQPSPLQGPQALFSRGLLNPLSSYGQPSQFVTTLAITGGLEITGSTSDLPCSPANDETPHSSGTDDPPCPSVDDVPPHSSVDGIGSSTETGQATVPTFSTFKEI